MKILPINIMSFASKNKKQLPTYAMGGNGYGQINKDEVKLSLPAKKKLCEQVKRGENIELAREQIILSQIPKAEKLAQKFVEEHPEFDKEDVMQEILLTIVMLTDNLEEYSEDFLAQSICNRERRILKRLLDLEDKKPVVDFSVKVDELADKSILEAEYDIACKDAIVDVLVSLTRSPKVVDKTISRFGLSPDDEYKTQRKAGAELNCTHQAIEDAQRRMIGRIRENKYQRNKISKLCTLKFNPSDNIMEDRLVYILDNKDKNKTKK